MHLGADIMSGRRTANAAPAKPRTARPTSTFLRVRPGGADGDALWLMPSLETDGRCAGVWDCGYVVRSPVDLVASDEDSTDTAQGSRLRQRVAVDGKDVGVVPGREPTFD